MGPHESWLACLAKGHSQQLSQNLQLCHQLELEIAHHAEKALAADGLDCWATLLAPHCLDHALMLHQNLANAAHACLLKLAAAGLRATALAQMHVPPMVLIAKGRDGRQREFHGMSCQYASALCFQREGLQHWAWQNWQGLMDHLYLRAWVGPGQEEKAQLQRPQVCF